MTKIFLMFIILLPRAGQMANGQAYKYHMASVDGHATNQQTVVGTIRSHSVAGGETLLDIARHYGLGFNELSILYPEVDPWIPEVGSVMNIPTQWVLPSTKYHEIVINLAELRLYRFFPRSKMVKTYPIGIGEVRFETPEGAYSVTAKEIDPVWIVPDSLRKYHDFISLPPGPRNPLGKYWIGLSRRGYGIHGTNFPWCVGRMVSRGCIRLYPEDIVQLFHEVSAGTVVEVVYQPVKVGIKGEQVFVEVHPDIYGKGVDMEGDARKGLLALGCLDHIFVQKLEAALKQQDGVPVEIGTIRKGGEEPSVAYISPLDRLERR
jgi:L,D-transpeptidase ErfK/SrfK